MAISNKIAVMMTIALVNTLARLHNFCLGKVIPVHWRSARRILLVGRRDILRWRIATSTELQCRPLTWM